MNKEIKTNIRNQFCSCTSLPFTWILKNGERFWRIERERAFLRDERASAKQRHGSADYSFWSIGHFSQARADRIKTEQRTFDPAGGVRAAQGTANAQGRAMSLRDQGWMAKSVNLDDNESSRGLHHSRVKTEKTNSGQSKAEETQHA